MRTFRTPQNSARSVASNSASPTSPPSSSSTEQSPTPSADKSSTDTSDATLRATAKPAPTCYADTHRTARSDRARFVRRRKMWACHARVPPGASGRLRQGHRRRSAGSSVVNANQRAMRAVYASFLLNGAGAASMLSRVPQIRDALHLRPGPLGLLLLMAAIGSLVSLPLAGSVVYRFGPARTVMVMSATCAIGLAIVAIGTRVGTPMVAIGLFVVGFGAGQWDVAQNVEGAAVEQAIGRSIMSRFHAAFSIGTVIGALGGAAMNALHVDPIWHLLTAAILMGTGVRWQAAGFLPAGNADEDRNGERHDPWQAWMERRTLL